MNPTADVPTHSDDQSHHALTSTAPASAVDPASRSVIAAAEALIRADRAQELTTAHVDGLESAIAIQRGQVALPPARSADAQESDRNGMFPPMPLPVHTHATFGPLFDRISMHQYAALFADKQADSRLATDACPGVEDHWRSAAQAAISHLDYETDAPAGVKRALRALRGALIAERAALHDGAQVASKLPSRASHDVPAAMSPPHGAAVPESFLALCREEHVRGTLTSLPLKLDFMRERGLKDLVAVHTWMADTRRAFAAAVNAAGQAREGGDKAPAGTKDRTP